MTITDPYPDIAPLVGADPDIWVDLEFDKPFRVLYGVPRGIAGRDFAVQTSCCQYSDGHIDQGDDAPHVSLELDGSDQLSAGEARDLAATLLAAADELDGWAAR